MKCFSVGLRHAALFFTHRCKCRALAWRNVDSGPSGAFRGRVQTGISGFGRRVAPYRTLHVVFMFQTTESQIVQERDRLGGGKYRAGGDRYFPYLCRSISKGVCYGAC